jgi:thymidine phosphorylase
MLQAQGADLDAFRRKLEGHRGAAVTLELRATRAGFLTRCDARVIGEAVRDLGAGRLTKDSVLDYDAGVDHLAKPGDPVSAGSVLARIHGSDEARAMTALAKLDSAFEISESRPDKSPLVVDVLV